MTTTVSPRRWAQSSSGRFDLTMVDAFLYRLTFLAAISGAFALPGDAAGNIAGSPPDVALLLTVGAVFFASGVLPLRSWARTQRRQVEMIAEDLARRSEPPQGVFVLYICK